jgi:quercetin dioxygenase-like cupin family protein
MILSGSYIPRHHASERALSHTLVLAVALAGACKAGRPDSQSTVAGEAAVIAARESGRPAVIPLRAGERAWLDSSRFTLLKVDDRTVGARSFALGSEDLPPGTQIPIHRHKRDEELLIVHRGRVAVTLADVESIAEPGGVVFIPPETWVGVRSLGPDTATVFYVFPAIGFTDYMRSIGSPERGGRALSDTAYVRINTAHAIQYRRR